ncbi:DUF2971 domain-containing protein [Bacillus altitudinis]|uniref:DUF2971 domain-containing protein n=1 Tax=Bacillus altitudinis TaxID=293387 RepID=UPI000D7C2050|nr:DUF2971 domain-containing protein [Bacillus altitudinis]PYH27433.1 hypothetical protein US8_00055 [Bacillus altitudinis]
MLEYNYYKNYFFQNHISYLMGELNNDEVLEKYEVYHYTNIDGIEGILKKDGKFRVSHADFLNDKTEIKYTMELSVQIFLSLCEERGFTEEEISDFKELYDKAVSINDIMNTNYYSLSFSTNPDSNLLWANYSHNDGYSITFKYKELYDELIKETIPESPSSKKPKFVPIGSKVIYKESEQKWLLSKLLNEVLNRFKVKANEPNYDVNSDGFIINAVGVLEWYSLFFKDECFSQEEEFRIALLYLDNSDANVYECRKSNGTFIPYVEINFNRDSVKGVTIGPKNNMDINREGLLKFLLKQDYDLTKVNINKSEIPYRY